MTKPTQLKLRTSIHHFAPLTSYPELASHTLFTFHFFIIHYSLFTPKVPWCFATLTPKSPLGFCNTYSQKSLGFLQISIDNQQKRKRQSKRLSQRYYFRFLPIERNINDNLESMAQALYDYWFVQFDFPDENGRPYKSSGGKMVWNDKLKREIPEGWIIEPLENLCERITKGTTPSTLGFQFTDAGINFVKVESLTDKHIIDTKQLSYICENAHEALKRSQLKQFDLLFSIAGSIGRFAIVDEDILPANTNQAVAIIRCDRTRIHPYYVYATLLGDLHSSHCSQNVEKVCQANLSLGALSKMPILRCGTRLEELFLSRITPIIDRIQRLGVEQRKLTEQRNFLLPLLMNGQVQVKP